MDKEVQNWVKRYKVKDDKIINALNDWVKDCKESKIYDKIRVFYPTTKDKPFYPNKNN